MWEGFLLEHPELKVSDERFVTDKALFEKMERVLAVDPKEVAVDDPGDEAPIDVHVEEIKVYA